MRPARGPGLALALGAALAGCGGSELSELPLAGAHIDRRTIQLTVAQSASRAWVMYRDTSSGTASDVARWDGSTLTPLGLPTTAQTSSLALVTGDEIVTGGASVLDIQGTQITDLTDQLTGAATWIVAGRGDGVVYAIGNGVLRRRAAGATTWDPLASPAGGVREVIVAAPDRLVATGDGNGDDPDVFMHFDGTAWTVAPQGRTGRRLSAAAADDVWALPLPSRTGTPLQALAWDGSTWATVAISANAGAMGSSTPTLTVLGVIALGGHRAGAVLTRKWESIPPRYEIVWVTGDRSGLSSESVVRVFCNTANCTGGGDFGGVPSAAADGTLFVGPYYGSVPH